MIPRKEVKESIINLIYLGLLVVGIGFVFQAEKVSQARVQSGCFPNDNNVLNPTWARLRLLTQAVSSMFVHKRSPVRSRNLVVTRLKGIIAFKYKEPSGTKLPVLALAILPF